MTKAVVLVSGGIDSTVCLTKAVLRFGAENVTGLSLLYGQKHSKELQSAQLVTQHFGVRHIVKDLTDVFTFSNSPLLARSEGAIPEGSYAEAVTRDADGMSKTYVPYRNGLFLSYAAAIAYSIGATIVFYGAHADDAAGNAYPDCSTDFYQAQADAIFLGTGQKVEMEAPLIRMYKKDIVKEGFILGAPLHLTWSCYVGKEKACGKCGTCRDRLDAFAANNELDHIPYEYDGE